MIQRLIDDFATLARAPELAALLSPNRLQKPLDMKQAWTIFGCVGVVRVLSFLVGFGRAAGAAARDRSTSAATGRADAPVARARRPPVARALGALFLARAGELDLSA